MRRPIALATSADGRWLYVANRDSGSLSVIDVTAQQVVAEHAIGKRLSDVKCLPSHSDSLIADEAAHELVLANASGQQVEVVQRLPVSPYPVSIEIAPGGKEATIASLWSRRLTFVGLGDQAASVTDARSAVCAALPALLLARQTS